MKRGQITVFLALLLSVICGLLLIIVESTRVNAMRMQIESGMDISLHSILAEYNRALLSRYDLFYIDMSYGEAAADIRNTETHLHYYLDANLSPDSSCRTQTGDWFRMSIPKVQVTKYLLSSDHEGRVFGRQAVNYMKEYAVYEQLPDGRGIYQEIQAYAEAELSGDRNRAEQGIKEMALPVQVSHINALRGEDVLALVMEGKEISSEEVNVQTLISHRNPEMGSSGMPFRETVMGEEADRLFDAYIFQKCSYETKQLSQSVLRYEIEYMIEGQESDRENMNRIAARMLRLREAANVAYLYGDEEKLAEAEELAVLLADGLEVPGLIEALTHALLYAWGYAEAALDVNRLINDGQVPVMKSSEDWRLPLKDLLVFRSYMGEGGGSGLCYQEYLSAYLAKETMSEKRKRCMDMIEANVRNMEGNSYFRMDGCAEYIEAYAEISSDYGYAYDILRSYGYEKESMEAIEITGGK